MLTWPYTAGGGAVGAIAPGEKSKLLIIIINLLILNIDYCRYSQKDSAELRRKTRVRCFETHVWVLTYSRVIPYEQRLIGL